MNIPKRVLLAWAAAAAVATAGAAAPSTVVDEDTHLEEAKAIFDWVSGTRNGWVTPKQELRRGDDGFIGVYAKKRIEKGEILVRIPWENIIKSDDPNEEGQLCCGTVEAVAREMKLGESSRYGPYAVYLNHESDGQIPTGWSTEGQNLLLEVMDHDAIPPEEPTDWLRNDWWRRCRGDPKDEISNKAALLVVQRSDDSIMIPAYDAYNHRNGKWTNTETNIEWGEYHETKATRAIEAGEQIYITYNQCNNCFGRQIGYGTAEIFRDYGFIERYPQRWHYMDEEFQFDIDMDENGQLEVTWHSRYQPKRSDDKLMHQTILWFHNEIRRLKRIKNIDWNFDFEDKRNPGIPKHEWDTVWEFVDANIVAMTAAAQSLEADMNIKAVEANKPIPYPNGPTCGKNGTSEECKATDDFRPPPISANGPHYDPLHWEFDDLDYQVPTCNNRQIMKFRDYEDIEFVKTAYQAMTFVEKKETNDLCMDLDDIVQICANYRPQYHEYVTHAAARFVKDIRRVIFIGGGDSMLLHEVLKYPNVELIVGLELDQTVTRKCFKHFKTSPHFDDPRVEWWFGDATKSMLLLPEEYWGSFDLVLVDLSETVMSFSVTKELDVFDALALLLSPVGVMVKNEMYMEKFSQVFDYTMALYYESPIICSQVLAFGSNNVDFFRDPTYDHGVETFLYNKNIKGGGSGPTPETRYDLMHDYRKNIAPAEHCNLSAPPEPSEQDTAAGIVEIVNAEDCEIPLGPDIVNILQNVAKKHGFSVLDEPTYDQDMAFVVMKEGYIAARLFPDEDFKYVGFDINLWGNTYKIKSVRDDLLRIVKSSNVSAYRVVVGGMYGSNTWKKDQKLLGPKVKQLRNCNEDSVQKGRVDLKAASAAAVEEVVALTNATGITAVVVCGKDSDKCDSVNVLSAYGDVKEVIPIYQCPSLNPDDVQTMYTCETFLEKQMFETVTASGKKMHLLVFDNSASYETHQLFLSIMGSRRIRKEWFQDHSITVTSPSIIANEPWRREFLEHVRKTFEYDPAVRAEFVFQAGGETYEFGVFSTNDRKANYAFEKLEKALKSRLSDVNVELRKIWGGLFEFKRDWKPTVFKQEDYDSAPGTEQYENQRPLGRQNIFQLVRGDDVTDDLKLSMPKIKAFIDKALKTCHIEPSTTKQFSNVGDGGVIAAFAEDANLIVVWDGREHIDVSLFTYDEARGLPEKFMGAFLHSVERKMDVGLRDDQPRGTGRVINFPSDMDPEGDGITKYPPRPRQKNPGIPQPPPKRVHHRPQEAEEEETE